MSKSVTLTMRIEPALKQAAQKAAARDGRSLTNWIEKLIAENAREAKR